MYHFYKITNNINNKSYIGFTSRYHASIRWKEHLKDARNGKGFALHAAIRKYGEDGFTWKVLETKECTLKEAQHYESLLIEKYETSVKNNGYNLVVLQEQPKIIRSPLTKSQKANIAEKTKIGMSRPEVRQQISDRLKAYYNNGGVSPMKGKAHRLESIQKMSATTKAMVTDAQREQMRQMSLKQWKDPDRRQQLLNRIQNPSKQTRTKMSRAKLNKPTWNKGKEHTQESIERMSAIKRGKKVSLETKQKMSVSRSAYLTPEHRLIQSQRMKGHTNLTGESKRKIGAANGSKYTYRVTLPDGSQEIVSYLAEFCRAHHIKVPTALAASKTGRKIKSGFRFELVGVVNT